MHQKGAVRKHSAFLVLGVIRHYANKMFIKIHFKP